MLDEEYDDKTHFTLEKASNKQKKGPYFVANAWFVPNEVQRRLKPEIDNETSRSDRGRMNLYKNIANMVLQWMGGLC